MATTTDDRSLGQMFADLSRDTRMLIHQEIELTRVELAEKASRMGRGAALLVGGGLMAYGGFLAFLSAAVLSLIAAGVPAWGAALLGGVLLAAVGYLLIRSGLAALRPRHLTPRHTIDSLKEDARWLRSQTR